MYCILKISQKDVLFSDVLSLWTFCPSGRFVSTDVSSLRTFRPSGRFVSPVVFVPQSQSLAVFSPAVWSPDFYTLRTFCFLTYCLGTKILTPNKHVNHIQDKQRQNSSQIDKPPPPQYLDTGISMKKAAQCNEQYYPYYVSQLGPLTLNILNMKYWSHIYSSGLFIQYMYTRTRT